MASVLKPDQSLSLSLATVVMVAGIFQVALPSTADVRSIDQGNQDLEASERVAGWMAASVVSGVALLAKDPTVFIFGSAAVIGITWWHRHSDMVNPLTGKALLGMDVGDFVPPQTQEEKPAAYQAYDTSVF